MRSDNHFVALVFFSILSIIMTTIFSSIIISQNNDIKNDLQNNQ